MLSIYDFVVMGNDEKVIDWLETAEDLEILDPHFQRTPLQWACWACRSEIALTLINAKANVNATDPYQGTPLHWACHQQMEDVVIALIEADAPVNNVNSFGDNAFTIASDNNAGNVALLLANIGCDIGNESILKETKKLATFELEKIQTIRELHQKYLSALVAEAIIEFAFCESNLIILMERDCVDA